MTKRVKRVLKIGLLAAIMLLAIFGTIERFRLRAWQRQIKEKVDWVAASYTADLIVAYVKEHRGEWPQSWKDLEPVFRAKQTPGGMSISDFLSLRESVLVEWGFTSESLLQKAQSGDGPEAWIVYPRNPHHRSKDWWGANHKVLQCAIQAQEGSSPISTLPANH